MPSGSAAESDYSAPTAEAERSWRATPTGDSNLANVPDEVAISIACKLDSPLDLLRLSLVCQRFRAKTVADPEHRRRWGSGKQPPPELWSVTSEAARRWIVACPELERDRVPRWSEDWLALMAELQTLRLPLKFGRAHPALRVEIVAVYNNRASQTVQQSWAKIDNSIDVRDHQVSSLTAASKVTMRAGIHFALFTVLAGYSKCTSFGLIRPGYDVVGTRERAFDVDGHCFYQAESGRHCPGAHEWEGMEPHWTPYSGPVSYHAEDPSGIIGMLLNLDAGTMTIFKNEKRLGVMATGLSGEYCWAATLGEGASVCIQSAPTPEDVYLDSLPLGYVSSENEDSEPEGTSHDGSSSEDSSIS